MSHYMDSKDAFLQPVVQQYNNHMVMTNVSRPTKTKYWNIDTQFRDDYQDGINGKAVVVGLPETINNVRAITVTSLQLPLTFYNVAAGLNNNLLHFVDLSQNTTHILTVPDGYYTASALASAINAQFVAAGYSNLTVSINGQTTISCSSTSNYAYTLSFAVTRGQGVDSCFAPGAINFDKHGLKNHLGWMLGFRGITYTVVGQRSIVSEGVCNVVPKYVYLVVDEFLTSNPNSFVAPMFDSVMNKNVLAKINLDYVFYGWGTVLPANLHNGYLNSDRREYTGNVNLKKLKVQIVNETGFAVNLNGADFSFVLQIEYQ